MIIPQINHNQALKVPAKTNGRNGFVAHSKNNTSDTATFTKKQKIQTKTAGLLAALALLSAATPTAKAANLNETAQESPYVSTYDVDNQGVDEDINPETKTEICTMEEAMSVAENMSSSDIFAIMSRFDLPLSYITMQERAATNQNIINDTAKAVYARENGMTLEEVFVPEFDSPKEAKENLKAGEVFQIKGSDRIGIVKTDGTVLKLGISPKKYLELFPPIAKYCVKQQVNDCYLASTLLGLMEKPDGMAQILSCFQEREDGSIVAGFPKGVSFAYIENGKTIDDYIDISEDNPLVVVNNRESKSPSEVLAKACEGIRILEFLFGKEKVNTNMNSRMLIEALDENKDQAKISELHHYYEEDLMNTRQQTVDRGARGGAIMDVTNMFYVSPISINNGFYDSYNLKNCLGEFFESIPVENWDSYLVMGETNSGNRGDENEPLNPENPYLSPMHAYYLKPAINKDGVKVVKIINPWNTSYSVDVPFDKFESSYFGNVDVYRIK